MNVSFKTKILYNGKDFSSVDELPPEIRAIYERALENRSNKLMSTGNKVLTQLVVNGHEVESTKELSEDAQKLYADAMQLLKDSGAPTDHKTTDNGPREEIGWLTANQKRLVAAVAGLVLIAAIIIALRAL